MKKIILSLTCATILTSSFAMNTPIQKINSVQQQSTTINQQAQAKSALWQIIKANPALSAVLPLYITLVLAGNGLFVWDAKANGYVSATKPKSLTESLFNQDDKKWLNSLNSKNTNDNPLFAPLTRLHAFTCPGLSTINTIKLDSDHPLTTVSTQLLTALIIIAILSGIASGIDLTVALTLYKNNPEIKNKNLLLPLFNKIFRRNANATQTETDLIKN